MIFSGYPKGDQNLENRPYGFKDLAPTPSTPQAPETLKPKTRAQRFLKGLRSLDVKGVEGTLSKRTGPLQQALFHSHSLSLSLSLSLSFFSSLS